MANIIVTLPGRGQITFEEGTPDSVINETIAREFPKDGSDVARIIAEDPSQAKSLSNEDFGLYEGFLEKKKTDWVSAAASGAGYLMSTVGTGIKGLFEARNLNPQVAAATAIESGAQGTRDLYGLLAQSEDPSSVFFKFKDWINGTGTVEDRKKQWLEARDFSENTRKMEAGQQTLTGIDPALVNNDVKNALKYAADFTLLFPGIGELLGAGKIGARVTGAAMQAAGRTAQAITRPLVNIVDASTRIAGEAFGANAGAIKGLAAGSGVTGVVMGVPGVREAALAIGTIEGVNKAGKVLETAGQALGRTPTRIGALESLALNPNASAVDRALAKVGRYGGDDLIDLGARSAAGAVEGAVIGTTLGYLSAGEEGAASGLGAGTLLGGAGAGAARLYGKASGAAAIENRHGDYKRFYETLDSETQAKFDTIVKQSGLDGASQVMDVSGIIRGKFNDADVRFSTSEEFAKKYGQDARGVQVNEGDRPIIDINVDKFSSQLTAGHEIFHAFKAIDQLRPMAEKVESMIVGNYIIDGNGQSVKTSPGILSEADVLKRFDEYLNKFNDKDGNTTLPENDKFIKANTLLEKTKLVGEELGAEYMTRMIAGSDTDVMLRGFDGLTRTILDHALLSNTDGFIRRTAQSIGLGSKPIESLVFSKLENASPALNAALRDMVRARRNMSEKIALADDNGYSISRKDLANPAAAKVATDMGIAEVSPDGIVRMKPDDVLAKEDRESADALANAIKAAPVIDASEPRLREVDGQVIGDGISNAQLAAIQASPSIIDKVKQAISIVKDSIDNGNVIFIRNGKATKEVRSKLTGKTLKRYNDGVRITERDVVPYSLATSKAGELYIRTFDISKARGEAMKLAGRDRLGPYGADFQAFYGDLTRYLNNLSDRVNRVPTKELLGDAAKAAYLTEFFGGKDGTSAKYIRNFTLDRMVDMRLTGEKVNMSQTAYDLNKIGFMPAESIGDGKVFNSPDSGFKIISKNAGKHSLYAPTGERVGIYDTQAGAERKANQINFKNLNLTEQSRFMPTSTDEFLKAAVGDSATNLKMKLAKRPGTGVARNEFVEFHDKVGRPIGIGADAKEGGKPFEVWKRETEQWFSDAEIANSRKWYRELHDKFVGIFGEKRAGTMMMAWLAAQQNVSPGGALGNVFKVEDRLAGIGTGKKGGLADEKIQGVLTQTVPEKGFGAKLTDFVDAGFLKKLRTYMGGDLRGGRPFVADVHTGRDSGHVDQQTLSRLAERSAEGDLFIGGKSAQVKITKTKTVKNGDKVSEVPTRVLVRVDGMKPFGIEIDMTGSPSGSQYEGISEWGNNLTDHLNKAEWKGGNWEPSEAQAVGWMRVLRQYGLAEPTVVSALAQNTSRLYAEVNYGSGATLNKNFPDFGKLSYNVQTAITKDVMERFVPMVAEKIGGSLRVQNISLGDGVFGSTKAPSVAIELLGSAEAVDMFAISLAHASDQAATMSAVFGTGGKDSRSLRFKKADGTKFTDSEINSLLTNAEISGFSVHQLPGGNEALITDAKADYTPKSFTEKKAQILFSKLTDWADKTNIALDVKSPSTKVTSYANNWSSNQEGQAYLDLLNKRGGASRIREVVGLRGQYRTVLEQSFDRHAPGVRQQGPEVTGQRFMPSETPEAKFYSSRIISAVENSSQGKANGSQWKATIKNSKLGVNQDEYALTRVEDLEPGKTYTKAEVLDYLRANQVVVKDVTLGAGGKMLVNAEKKLTDAGYTVEGDEYFGAELYNSTGEKVDPTTLTPELRSAFETIKKPRGEGDEGGDTHFSEYTLPGAKEGSYREVLLTTETTNKVGGHNYETGKKVYRDIDWRDGHSQYADIPNPIVRLRTNERTTANGKRMLFIEEIQAPQKGEFEKMPALFQKNWRDIAFKWTLRTAADNGFDSVGWTTGEQQAARYDLSKQLSEISYSGSNLKAFDKNGEVIISQTGVQPEELPNIIGKEAAKKIMEQEPKGTLRTISGIDLKVGGEGLKKLYDQDFRNVVNNLPVVKKSGQKVAITGIFTDKKGWHLTPPNQTTHGGWMVKSAEYNSKGTRFNPSAEGEAAARAFLAKQLNDSKVEVHSITITPEMRNASVSFMPSMQFSESGVRKMQAIPSVPQRRYTTKPGDDLRRKDVLVGWLTEGMVRSGSANYSHASDGRLAIFTETASTGSNYVTISDERSGEQLRIRYSDHFAPGGGGYRVNEMGSGRSQPPDYNVVNSKIYAYQNGKSGKIGVAEFRNDLLQFLNDGLPEASFMPAMQFSAPENLPNGKVWRGENGYAIIQKEGGKFRVHSPIGLIGIAASYEAAEKMANKRNNK